MAEQSSKRHSDEKGLHFTPLLLASAKSSVEEAPHRVYLVDMVDSLLFEESISRLMRAPKIGLVGKGEALGREGILSLLVFSTQEEVFVFDILLLAVDGFKYGLFAVLQRPDLIKVVHDVRHLSDILYHQFQVTLVNVFDTMAAHLVVANWEADMPRRKIEVAPTLEDTLRRFQKRVDLDPGVLDDGSSPYKVNKRWRLRSLPKQLLLEAATSALLLLPLAKVLELKMAESVNRASEALLNEVRDMEDDSRAMQSALSPQFNPDSMTTTLPMWRRIILLK